MARKLKTVTPETTLVTRGELGTLARAATHDVAALAAAHVSMAPASA